MATEKKYIKKKSELKGNKNEQFQFQCIDSVKLVIKILFFLCIVIYSYFKKFFMILNK